MHHWQKLLQIHQSIHRYHGRNIITHVQVSWVKIYPKFPNLRIMCHWLSLWFTAFCLEAENPQILSCRKVIGKFFVKKCAPKMQNAVKLPSWKNHSQNWNFAHPLSSLSEICNCLSEFCQKWAMSVKNATSCPTNFLTRDAAAYRCSFISPNCISASF